MNDSYLPVIKSLLSVPTCPFREQAVIGEVCRWAAQWDVGAGEDAAGNIYLRRCGKAGAVRWFFTAHMDHPGFIARSQRGLTLHADFLGTVRHEYFVGSSVMFFTPAGPVRATVQAATTIKDTPWLACRMKLDRPAPVPPDTVGMWDLPAYRVSGRKLITRACDDVVGSAAVLCALRKIVASRIDADVTVLLTRAEEAGFVGALAACDARAIPRGASIISIETSAALPNARLGDGVVVRAGDAARMFDPTLTAHISAVAKEQAAKDKDFHFTCQLMTGGVCESTVFCNWGYQAAGLCIPLGNYHNMGPGGRIAAERIDLGDFDCLVKLLVAIAACHRKPQEVDDQLHSRLQNMLKQRGRFLKE
jgi:putative aminopeptidase FrvX